MPKKIANKKFKIKRKNASSKFFCFETLKKLNRFFINFLYTSKLMEKKN